MNFWKFLTLSMMIFLGATLPGNSQLASGWESSGDDILPPRPVSGVLDDSRILNRDPESYRSLVEGIRSLREKYGFELYVVVRPVLIGSTVSDLAAKLQKAWLPDGNGLVVVYETDRRNLGFGRGLETPIEGGSRHPGEVPAYKTLGLISEVMDTLDPQAEPDVYMKNLVTKLLQKYREYFLQRDAPGPADRNLKVALVIAGVACVLGLGALGLGALARRADASDARKSYVFPPVEIPERLGAPYGGGKISSRRFSRVSDRS